MKGFICLLLVVCLAVPVLGATLEQDRKALRQLADEIEREHAAEIEVERKSERIALIIAGVVNLSVCMWGSSQNSTYGTITGLFFGLRFGGNMMEYSTKRRR